MKELNWPTRLCVLGTALLAILLIGWQWYHQPIRLNTPGHWAAFVVGGALVALASARPIRLRRSAHISLGTVFGFAAICIFDATFGTALFVLGSSLAYAFNQWRGRYWKWYQILFSIAAQALALGLGGTLYLYLQRGDINPVTSLQNALAFVLAGSVFVLLNDLLIAIVIGLSERTSVKEVLLLNWQGSSLQLVSHVPLSGIVIILYLSRPWAVLLIFLPLVAIHLSLEEAARLRAHTQQTLQFVAQLVDTREPFTARHSLQVAQYAAAIAQEARVPLPQQEIIRVAATVHDVGKLSIPESVLLKGTPLEPAEWSYIRSHPAVGATLVQQLPFLRETEEIIRCHHEYYDGSGYPEGIKGEDIPLGARVLAIADALDAITASRPYRDAASLEEAFIEIQGQSGGQFDPRLVEATLRARPRLEEIYLSANHGDGSPEGD
jgi:putative nucleotidyltransferase with HDIG domain